jgi:hypothetical protein
MTHTSDPDTNGAEAVSAPAGTSDSLPTPGTVSAER